MILFTSNFNFKPSLRSLLMEDSIREIFVLRYSIYFHILASCSMSPLKKGESGGFRTNFDATTNIHSSENSSLGMPLLAKFLFRINKDSIFEKRNGNFASNNVPKWKFGYKNEKFTNKNERKLKYSLHYLSGLCLSVFDIINDHSVHSSINNYNKIG